MDLKALFPHNHEDRGVQMIANDFRDHLAKRHGAVITNGTQVDYLIWGRPTSSSYLMIFMAVGNSLIVRGDCGEAIYSVYENQPLEFWAKCDISYLHDKCQASPGGAGRQWMDWDTNECERRIDENVKDLLEYDEYVDVDLVREAKAASANKDEFSHWLATNGEQFLGPNWTDHDPWLWGQVMPHTLKQHWVGLRLAMHQLENRS